jgi:hypothetical protein
VTHTYTLLIDHLVWTAVPAEDSESSSTTTDPKSGSPSRGEIDGRASAASSGSPELGEESTNVPDSTILSSVASASAGTAVVWSTKNREPTISRKS